MPHKQDSHAQISRPNFCCSRKSSARPAWTSLTPSKPGLAKQRFGLESLELFYKQIREMAFKLGTFKLEIRPLTSW